MNHLLVIDGHPRPGSFGAALAAAYSDGARSTGADVDVLTLRELDFDLDLHHDRVEDQPLEPCLARAQALLVASDHVTVVAPVWWGSVPARLKGFLDRVLVRGWAYRYQDNGLPEGLLAGRSARVIITTDSPGWWLRGLMGDSAVRQLTRSTLRFCGLKPVATTRIGAVHGSTDSQRAAWLDEAREAGRRDAEKVAAGRRGVKAMPQVGVGV